MTVIALFLDQILILRGLYSCFLLKSSRHWRSFFELFELLPVRWAVTCPASLMKVFPAICLCICAVYLAKFLLFGLMLVISTILFAVLQQTNIFPSQILHCVFCPVWLHQSRCFDNVLSPWWVKQEEHPCFGCSNPYLF